MSLFQFKSLQEENLTAWSNKQSFQQSLQTEKLKTMQTDAKLLGLQEKLESAVAERDRWMRALHLRNSDSVTILEDPNRDSFTKVAEDAVKDYNALDSHIRTESKLIEFRSNIGRRYGRVKYAEWLRL